VQIFFTAPSFKTLTTGAAHSGTMFIPSFMKIHLVLKLYEERAYVFISLENNRKTPRRRRKYANNEVASSEI
jgi:hypothetical protein